jgi:hypothetical protein
VSVTDEDGTYSAAPVQTQAVLATSQQATVAELYVDLLGRSVDQSGLQTYSAMLSSGTPIRDVITAIVSSPEFQQKAVNDLYLKYLGRTADPSGLASSVALYQSGGQEAVIANLVGSDEFYAKAGGTNDSFLAVLYQSVLGRPIDPTGQADFLRQFAFGVSRDMMVRQLLESPEGSALQVNAAYENYLGREADPAGIQSWSPTINSNTTTFLINFLSEPEYSAPFLAIQTNQSGPTAQL